MARGLRPDRGRTVVVSHQALTYSYSKIRAFETCPLKFQYRYLERLPADLESIEAFTGKRVHEVLEALYRSLAADRPPPELGEVLALYDQAWRRAWHPGIEVVKESYSPRDYHRLGGRCLTTFYRGNWPFTADRTLGLETEVAFDLQGPGSPRLAGVLDRVASRPGGELLIHDYKTSTYLPRQDEILGDLQLAIYQLGAAERWPGAREVKLIWHFLAFGRRVTVRLGRAGIEEKRAQLGRRIEGIERAVAAGDLPARVSRLCQWCSYRRLCPAYGQPLAWTPAGQAASRGGAPVSGRPGPALIESEVERLSPRPSLKLRPLPKRRTGRRAAPALAQLRLW